MRKRRLAGATLLGGIAALLLSATVALAAPSSRQVIMLDACDGPSFNLALNDDEACMRPGGVTFDTFIGQLVTHGTAPAWRFAPEQATLAAGGTITAPNKGGEFHSFTEVATFGGGCIPVLNALLGLTPVPECAGFPGILFTTGAPAGGSVTTGALSAGTHLFECLIHPWMRTTVTVD
jgi:plastocyanin